jgi:glycosyltransferase involved in cell wall biosynthesis
VAVMTRSRIERPILFILVTCNAMRWLPDVVESLEASGCGDVWAVDHGSTDGTWEWLVHHLDTDARVRAPNLGFGRGNNRGLRVAQTRGYRYVYLVNQDARVEPEGVRMMYETVPPFRAVLRPRLAGPRSTLSCEVHQRRGLDDVDADAAGRRRV